MTADDFLREVRTPEERRFVARVANRVALRRYMKLLGGAPAPTAEDATTLSVSATVP
jgi:hypothetical protein